MSIILKAENISKQYRLGLVGTGTISHDLNRFWHKIRGKEDPYLKVGALNDRSSKASEDYVWALRDINFEVQQGEVLGIIGKNGAGKSTLLKILSRVTSPTTGVIKTKGRIASLLEVGTGFHPELTGRENIFLNGAILGMTKAEISSRLDEIISFSGCEMYVDTPVKRYSSGMRVRLAFAVAAHLEPDILVVDEVLAVGDAEFQKKAIGKMQDISQGEGRTVLFVSHNMAAVKSLCSRAIVLENGYVVCDGNTTDAIDFYLKSGSSIGLRNYISFQDDDYKGNEVIPISFGIKAKGKEYEAPILVNDVIEINIEFQKIDKESEISTTVQIKNSNGDYILVAGSSLSQNITNKDISGKILFTSYFQANFFNSEEFFVDLLFVKNSRNRILRFRDVISFHVIEDNKELGTWMGKSRAPIKIELDWRQEVLNREGI